MNLRGPTGEAPAIASVELGRRSRPEIVVEVTRGDALESCHRVFAAIADASGDTLALWGTLGRAIYPRSAVKALQALPIVETGAADAFATDEELALACASHRGERQHTERVIAWLGRVGLGEVDRSAARIRRWKRGRRRRSRARAPGRPRSTTTARASTRAC